VPYRELLIFYQLALFGGGDVFVHFVVNLQQHREERQCLDRHGDHLFYHLKFGTSFKGIYYLRKFGTVVSIDLTLAPKSKKGNSPSVTSDILPADLEVHDVEDFEGLPFKRSIPPDGVIIVVDSTSLSDPAVVYHLTSLLSSPHIVYWIFLKVSPIRTNKDQLGPPTS